MVEISLSGSGEGLGRVIARGYSTDREENLHSMSADDLLLGSSFQLSSGGGQAGGSVWTAWGQFATGSFEAEVDDTELDGNVTSGFLGADIAGDRWLGGLALSMSKGDGDFSLMTDEDSGEVESTLTSVYPYGKIALTDKVDLWGMVGAGQGDVTLVQHADTHRAEDQSITTDIDMRMGAIGMRGEVLSGCLFIGDIAILVDTGVPLIVPTIVAVPGIVSCGMKHTPAPIAFSLLEIVSRHLSLQ